MLGRVEYARGKGKSAFALEVVAGVPCLHVTLTEPTYLAGLSLGRRIGRIKKAFHAHGVRRIIMPEGFPYADRFREWGPVDPMPFYRGIADLLALGSLAHQGISTQKAVVALSGPRLIRDLQDAAERLCPYIRGLAVDVPGEGELFARWLHREYGIAVYHVERADVTLAFGAVRAKRGVCIDLSGEQCALTRYRVTAPELQLPEEYEEQMLTVLWEQGRLDRTQIRVNRRDGGISS